jgi:hypothetical protein
LERARIEAVARPMPELAPVTKAVMFSRDLDIISNSFGHRPGSTHPVQKTRPATPRFLCSWACPDTVFDISNLNSRNENSPSINPSRLSTARFPRPRYLQAPACPEAYPCFARNRDDDKPATAPPLPNAASAPAPKPSNHLQAN